MSVIDDYLKPLEPDARVELERIRSICKSVMPGCEEVIAYGMPTMRYKGKNIFGFDAHKNHIGLYPYSGHVISEVKELKGYETTKGAIREKFDNLIPNSLIEKIIRERIKQAGV